MDRWMSSQIIMPLNSRDISRFLTLRRTTRRATIGLPVYRQRCDSSILIRYIVASLQLILLRQSVQDKTTLSFLQWQAVAHQDEAAASQTLGTKNLSVFSKLLSSENLFLCIITLLYTHLGYWLFNVYMYVGRLVGMVNKLEPGTLEFDHLYMYITITSFSVLSPSHFILALWQSCVLSTVVLINDE